MYCRSSFETDCLSVHQPASNWAALSLEWRWGTAGAFDWELFLFSLSRQLWPDCHKQPLVHITSTMTLVYTTFPINSSLKSIQAQTMHYGHMACANPALIKAAITHKPPHPTTTTSVAFIKHFSRSFVTFTGSLHCRPWCQEWCQPQTDPAQPPRQDLDHGGRRRCLGGVQVPGHGVRRVQTA